MHNVNPKIFTLSKIGEKFLKRIPRTNKFIIYSFKFRRCSRNNHIHTDAKCTHVYLRPPTAPFP